jgi:hypothetical protein
MSKYILIRNKGELELEGLRLLGASTKRGDDSKIGNFGSGLKFAIAYLLRNGLDFHLYSGMEEVLLETKTVTLRDTEFEKILVNGEETSITLSWGEEWQKWQIMREIISNALDEPGFTIEKVTDIVPQVGTTSFYVPFSHFAEVFDNLSSYFRLDLTTATQREALPKPEGSVFRVYKKGINVLKEYSEHDSYGEEPVTSMFDYHLPTIPLNEERIADLYDVRMEIRDLLSRTEDKKVIREIYRAIINDQRHYLEVDLLTSSKYLNLSEKWLEVLNEEDYKLLPDDKEEAMVKAKGVNFIESNSVKFVSSTFVGLVQSCFGSRFNNSISKKEVNLDFNLLEPTEKQNRFLDTCINILKPHDLVPDYSIKVVEFYESYKVCALEGGVILISHALFDQGVSALLREILRESLTVKHNTSSLTNILLSILSEKLLEEHLYIKD